MLPLRDSHWKMLIFGENADIWAVSKFNTSNLTLCGNPAGNEKV